MKGQTKTKFECIVPILSVQDVPASLECYADKLGFQTKWDWGTPPTFACVARDGIQIFLCQGVQGRPGTWIQLFVDDVDALHEEYKKSGAIIRQPPTNFPWHTREMNVEDLDGHRFRMSSESTGPPDGVPLPYEG
jgi:predicted enzyme related to lactoylglutathione lyase